ncbi:MAG: archemetzincin [Acidobacteria bacterium]|nr:archemetzincin [Acidobacteriota bacterium]
MKRVQLLPIGKVDAELLGGLAALVPDILPVQCEVLPEVLDPAPAFHGERLQYHSSELLRYMARFLRPGAWRLLGVTAVDLYIPILTYVFGEAQLEGPCAIVSYHRLRQEAYGLPADEDLLLDRLLKESVHELAHTGSLLHCEDYQCVMSPSHGAEQIDLKGSRLCAACFRRLNWAAP